MGLLKDLLSAYRTMKKEGEGVLAVVKNPLPPKGEGEVRRILVDPPAWVLLTRKLEGGLWEGIALTDWVDLAKTSQSYPGYLVTREAVLVPLPSFLYLREEFLKKHTKPVGRASREVVLRLTEYVLSAKIPKEGICREFLEEEIPRLEAFSLLSVIRTIEEEELRTAVTVIILSERLREAYRRVYTGTPSARGEQKHLRGRNWLGVVEGRDIRLYLPARLRGKRVRIKLRGETLFEGETGGEILIRNLPEVPDLSVLEKDLEVEDV
jgi:hypothetical protein